MVVIFRAEFEGGTISEERILLGNMIIFNSVGFFILLLLTLVPNALKTDQSFWQLTIGLLLGCLVLVHDVFIGIGIANYSSHIAQNVFAPLNNSSMDPGPAYAISNLLILPAIAIPVALFLLFLHPTKRLWNSLVE